MTAPPSGAQAVGQRRERPRDRQVQEDSPLLRRRGARGRRRRGSPARRRWASAWASRCAPGADVADRTQVLFASGMTSQALAARLAARERHRVRGAGRASSSVDRAQRSALLHGSARRRHDGRAAGRPVVPARAVRRRAVVHRCRAGMELHARQSECGRRGARHGGALRSRGPEERRGRRQPAAGLRHGQRCPDGQ